MHRAYLYILSKLDSFRKNIFGGEYLIKLKEEPLSSDILLIFIKKLFVSDKINKRKCLLFYYENFYNTVKNSLPYLLDEFI